MPNKLQKIVMVTFGPRLSEVIQGTILFLKGPLTFFWEEGQVY